MKIYKELFTIWDSTANAAERVFVANNPGLAVRSFEMEANTLGSDLAKYADYMTLFHIGRLNVETMELEPLATPVSLGLARTFIRQSLPVPQDPEVKESTYEEVIKEFNNA